MSDTFVDKGGQFAAMSSLAVGASVRLRKKKAAKPISEIANELKNVPETEWKLTTSQKGDDDKDGKWEVARSQIKQTKQLGSGAFGTVYETIATKIKPNQPTTKVAVKMLSDETPQTETAFFKEVAIMKALDGPYKIVRLLGVCTEQRPFLMIMELMTNGDLKSLLRDNRPKPTSVFSLQDLVRMSSDIAEGMNYLASVKIVHRDLAARNCLVDEAYCVKIGDFGLTRDVFESDYYRMTGSAPLPIRWMSPEAIMDGVYTTQSDVWSFGVVLWELMSFAQIPYAGLSNMEVCEQISDEGLRLACPKGCPDEVYNVMLACWNDDVKHRPSFHDMANYLLKLSTSLNSGKIQATMAKKSSVDVYGGGDGYSTPQEEYVLRKSMPSAAEQPMYSDQRFAGLSSFEIALKMAKESQAVVAVALPKGKTTTMSATKASEEYVSSAPYSHPTTGTYSPPTKARSKADSPRSASPRPASPSPLKVPTFTKEISDPKASVASAKAAFETKVESLKPTKAASPIKPVTSKQVDNVVALSQETRKGSAQTLIGKFDLIAEEPVTPVYSLKKQTKVDATKLEEKLLASQIQLSDSEEMERVPPSTEAEAAIRKWLEAAGGLEINDLEKSLKSGEVLCNLMNKISPGIIKSYHKGSKMAFKQMENIGWFLEACVAYGVRKSDLFTTVNLFEGNNMKQVVICISALSKLAEQKGFRT